MIVRSIKALLDVLVSNFFAQLISDSILLAYYLSGFCVVLFLSFCCSFLSTERVHGPVWHPLFSLLHPQLHHYHHEGKQTSEKQRKALVVNECH